MSGWVIVGSEGCYLVSLDGHNTPHHAGRFSACRYFFPDSLVRAMTEIERQDQRLYFRQLLSGRDFAREDPLARQMVNFCYLIGDRDSGEAVVVDPAYDVGGLLDLLAEDGMRLSGVLVSHAHPDHVGGGMMGYAIEGLSDLLEHVNVPVHVQRDEARWVTRATGVGESELVEHSSADMVQVGRSADRAGAHTRAHTRKSVLQRRGSARVSVTPCSSKDAVVPTCRAATPSRCTSRSRSALPGSATTPSFTRGISTLLSRRPRSARPACTIMCSGRALSSSGSRCSVPEGSATLERLALERSSSSARRSLASALRRTS